MNSKTVAESFFATLQTELLDRYDWPTRDGLRTAIFKFIEVFYNRQRRHSHLGNLSPVEFERRWHEQQHQTQVTSPKPSAEDGSLPVAIAREVRRACPEQKADALRLELLGYHRLKLVGGVGCSNHEFMRLTAILRTQVTPSGSPLPEERTTTQPPPCPRHLPAPLASW